VTLTNDAQASVNNTNPVLILVKLHSKITSKQECQRAYSLGLEYRDPKYWWISANVNYITNSYLDIAPISRTEIFYKNPANGFNFQKRLKNGLPNC
jgi:hypothetical protein